MTMGKRAPGKAMKAQIKVRDVAAAAAGDLPPQPKTPFAKKRSKKKTTTTAATTPPLPPLTVTRTTTSRTVNMPVPQTTERMSDDARRTSGGVVIKYDRSDVAIVVGTPKVMPPRLPSVNIYVVDWGVDPSPPGESGLWQREQEGDGSVLGAVGTRQE